MPRRQRWCAINASAGSRILVLTTGGTIEGFVAGSPAPTIRAVAHYLQHELDAGLPMQIKEICWKDSSAINLWDRLKMLRAMLASSTDNIVITHGTDTLITTQNFLALWMSVLGVFNVKKQVVLVGAFLPLSAIDTDAKKNLAFAFTAFNSLAAPGVYIAMQQQVFAPGTVRKNHAKRCFEAV